MKNIDKKQRLFEIIHKLDKTFKVPLNENLNNIDDMVDIDLINIIPKGETFYERTDNEYYNRLKNDITKNGIKEPIILRYNYIDNNVSLIDGHHRLKIANELNFKRVPVKIIVTWNKSNINDIKYNPPKKLDIEPYTRRNYYPTNIKPKEIGLN